MTGLVAIVLHAHLPWVRHPEHARSIEERWLFEALWESYLPLVGMLDDLERDGVDAPLTISLSPPLLEMLADPLLRSRFDDHLDRLGRLAERERARLGADATWAHLPSFHAGRIGRAREIWRAAGRDVTGALVRHAERGAVELLTTAATHAFLPGLAASPAAVRAQVEIGLATFRHETGAEPAGLWLPECAWDARLAEPLARAGVGYTVVDAHALELASPRPPLGALAPVLGPLGIAFFGRDTAASRAVWSREEGYPGDPAYREFWRDIGFDLPESELAGEIGPHGTRLMTGLKYHCVTGPGPEKAPYEPDRARARAREHAGAFVAERTASLREASARCRAWEAPMVVAPYDAELFGHWWLEGLDFLEAVLRTLDASARAGGPAATTLRAHLERHPDLTVAEPAASTWGEGGYARVWAGAEAAPLWRHVTSADRRVREALAGTPCDGGIRSRALDQAIREKLLLESSDWPFMIHDGATAEYARRRVELHRARIERLLAIARSTSPGESDEMWLSGVESDTPFLGWLRGELLRRSLG